MSAKRDNWFNRLFVDDEEVCRVDYIFTATGIDKDTYLYYDQREYYAHTCRDLVIVPTKDFKVKHNYTGKVYELKANQYYGFSDFNVDCNYTIISTALVA